MNCNTNDDDENELQYQRYSYSVTPCEDDIMLPHIRGYGASYPSHGFR